jgi:hypothetical protein
MEWIERELSMILAKGEVGAAMLGFASFPETQDGVAGAA